MNLTTITKTHLAATLSALTLLAAALPAFAGRVGGGIDRHDTVLGGTTDRYTMSFRGGETARIAAKGDGDIDLYVYDENGNEIAHDSDDDHVPVAQWTPRWTGRFTVKIVNTESYDVDYELITN